jgi:hypothetical protein
MRDFLSAWEGFRAVADEYRELDNERVLVLLHFRGRGKMSGLDVGQTQATGADLDLEPNQELPRPAHRQARRFQKPESEWIVREDENLRIVPSELWEAVRERRRKVKRSWPGGKGKRGFSAAQGSRRE